MTAPDYVAQVAELLREHQARGFAFDDECRCGWAIPETLRDGPAGMLMRPDRRAHLTHQAEVLAAAGLIPTSTEWGVRHPNLGPETRAIDPDLLDGYGDHWTILTRAVTDWKDATDD